MKDTKPDIVFKIAQKDWTRRIMWRSFWLSLGVSFVVSLIVSIIFKVC